MGVIADKVGVARAAVAVAAPGAVPVSELVLALLPIADARSAQLSRIEAKVDDVRDSHWRDAQDYIKEARALPDQATECLRNAASELKKAHGRWEREPDLAMWASLQRAVIEFYLGDRPRAKMTAAEAYAEAVRALEAQCRRAEHLAVGDVAVTKRVVHRATIAVALLVACVGLGIFVINAIEGVSSDGFGIIGLAVSLVSVGFIIYVAVLGTGAVAAGAVEIAKQPLKLAFRKHVEMLGDMASTVDEIRRAAIEFGVSDTELPRRELQVSDADLTAAYKPV